jgi:hypothetical protein
MEQNRHDFQQGPGHNPQTDGPKAGEQVSNTDLPHHATQQDRTSKEEDPNKELGESHEIVRPFETRQWEPWDMASPDSRPDASTRLAGDAWGSMMAAGVLTLATIPCYCVAVMF